MAPELIKGEEKYDSKVDIWAFGCIIYELFTREVCFNSINPLTLFNKIIEGNYGKINLEIYSSEWQDLIDSLLKIDPKERPDIEEVYNKVIDLKNKNPKKNNLNSSDTTNNNKKKKDAKKCFNFSGMFKDCRFLESIDISIYDPNKVLDYTEMCQNCVKLKTIKLPTFYNENTKMDNMFQNCHNLKTIYINSNLNIDQLKNQLKKDNINPEIIINNH